MLLVDYRWKTLIMCATIWTHKHVIQQDWGKTPRPVSRVYPAVMQRKFAYE